MAQLQQQLKQKNQMESEQETGKENATWKDNLSICDEIDKKLEIEDDGLKTKKLKDEEPE